MNQPLSARLTATKQQHILEAAARVFAEKGFHATTVKDVAQAAGIAQGSIYNYFENKTALLLGLFELMSTQARQEFAPTPPGMAEPRAVLEAALRHPLAALTAGNAELFRVIVSEVLVNRELAERFREQVLEPMIRSAAELIGPLFAPHASAALDLKVRAISGLMLGMILQRLMGDDVLEDRWDEVPSLLADLLVGGLTGRVP